MSEDSEKYNFDDGVYDGVKKVIIGEDSQGVAYIKIQYVRNGDVVQLEHGSERGTQITESEFEVNDPDEYITCIEGTRGEANRYDSDILMWNETLNRTVTELQFKTSHGRTSQKFGKPGADSFEFKLEGENGTKLVGLLGCSGRFLDDIEANFDVVSSALTQLEPQGGSDGHSWDDGAYDGLRKVCVGEDAGRVTSVEFVYAKGDQRITHCHGMDSNERKEFELRYEDGEYINSVEGTIDADGFVSSLIFNTSMGRSSEEFGKAVAKNEFFLKPIGFHKLVGFRGRCCVDRVNALGANFAVVVAPPVKKLQAQGIDFGEEWDDGIHDNVRVITVSYGYESVISVTFEYANGTGIVLGDVRGDFEEIGDKKEFKLCDNNEYIISVQGFFGQKLLTSAADDSEFESIYYKMKRLDFITNITTYSVLENDPSDGYKDVVPFKLEEKDHKIVGFHGKSTELSLRQIGVYVKPIDDAN
ncbi:Jacalin-related lectin 45 [Raphanus sativus]|nr:Jacalin-related lectin 45 [Raphanus sativus]